MTVKVFCARKIITMDPLKPEATHIAVQDGKILEVGGPEVLHNQKGASLHEECADKILMPGFIEGHSHLAEGSLWAYDYVGYYERRGPDGTKHPGLKSINAVIHHLQKLEKNMGDPETPLLVWGFDPVFFGTQRMSIADLDRVSPTRPVIVLHASLHLLNINSAVMTRIDIDPSKDMEGIGQGADGAPTGELQGLPGMFLAARIAGADFMGQTTSETALWNFARIAQIAGVTCATDLACNPNDADLARMAEITARPDYPLRLVAAFGANMRPLDDGLARVPELMKHNSEKLRFGIVKFVLDGSIQGFTARLRTPGYHNGAPNGLWYISPEAFPGQVRAFHRQGHPVHIHTNGDQASELAINVLEDVLTEFPREDHRHTLQHCQMLDLTQLRKMAELGIGANLFSNHLYYWGDAHYTMTIGPERASQMDNAGAAWRLGVPLAIHSDAPITAMSPLFTAWCAINRISAQGKKLGGEAEQLTLDQALYTITLGAACSLGLEKETGSLEKGKYADFAVLEEDPYEAGGENLKDVPVWGTVTGGHVFPSPIRP